MAAPPTYTFARGEPIVIGRRVLSGDPAGYTLVAVIKPAKAGLPGAAIAAVASFQSTFVAATPTAAAHWLLSLDPAALPAGRYVTDARFEKAGHVEMITQPAIIAITESVSGQ